MRTLIFLYIIMSLTACKTIQMGADATPDLLEHREVFEFPDKNKNELFLIAIEWFIDTFNSVDNDIQYQDKEEGKILGRFESGAEISIYNYAIRSTVSITSKDGVMCIHFKEPMFKTLSDDTGNVYNHEFRPLTKKEGATTTKQTWMALSDDLRKYIEEYKSW